MGRKNGGMVLRAGMRLVRVTRCLLWLILAGLGLFVVSSVLSGVMKAGDVSRYFALQGRIGMLNFLMGGSYLLFGLGICDGLLYYTGLFLVGLGQLVLNTCPAEEPLAEETEIPEEEVLPVECPEETLVEEVPAEAEEETEEDWQAILARDDALMPGVKTAEELVEELPPPGKSGRLVSPALMNILRYALGTEEDKQLEKALYNGLTRLTKDHEKNLIGHILHAPDGDIRAAADAVYKALSQKK